MKIIYCMLFAAVAMSGCTKSENGDPAKPNSDGVIRINSGIEARTKSAVNNEVSLTGVTFLRQDVDGTTPSTTFDKDTKLTGDREINGNIIFATPQLYNTNNHNSFFVAYWPVGTIDKDDYMGWTIDAKTDILLSEVYNAGKYSSPLNGTGSINGTPMNFKHQLAQLEVVCVAEPDAPEAVVQDTWGEITKIEVLGIDQVALYYNNVNSADALVGVNPDYIAMVQADYETAFKNVKLTKAATPAAITAAGMFVPAGLGETNPIKLKIITTKLPEGVAIDVQLKDANDAVKGLDKGKKHTATLVFKHVDKKIEVLSTTIEEWGVGYSGTEDVKAPAIGDLRDGGIVCWVDPNDSFNYKVVALKDANPDGSSITWAKTDATNVGIAGHSSADGRHNVAAMRAISPTLGVDFPAAQQCSGYATVEDGGKWYLPAQEELEVYMFGLADNQKLVWDAIAAAAGGKVPAGVYWSSTQGVTVATGAEGANPTVTKAVALTTANKVRCIKSSKASPLKTSAVGDYYYANTNIDKIVQPATAIVFWTDAAKPFGYKVISLGQQMKALAAKTTFTLTGLIDTDGAANVAIMKTYSTANTASEESIKTSGDFAIDFPAAAYCDTYNGDPAGTWYLPAKSELQHIWCAYNGVEPIAWETGTSAAAAAKTEVQTEWNNSKLQSGPASPANGNGVAFGAIDYWSSTVVDGTANAASVGFSDGATTATSSITDIKAVRCIRK